MNVKGIVGWLVTVMVLVFGMLLGGPIHIFLDAPSFVLVFGLTAGLLGVTYGLPAASRSLLGGMGRLLAPGHFNEWTPEEARCAANIASSAIRMAMLSAVVAGLLGFIAVLTSLEDPAALGPAMAVMMVSAFYALLLITLWFLPISRRFS